MKKSAILIIAFLLIFINKTPSFSTEYKVEDNNYLKTLTNYKYCLSLDSFPKIEFKKKQTTINQYKVVSFPKIINCFYEDCGRSFHRVYLTNKDVVPVEITVKFDFPKGLEEKVIEEYISKRGTIKAATNIRENREIEKIRNEIKYCRENVYNKPILVQPNETLQYIKLEGWAGYPANYTIHMKKYKSDDEFELIDFHLKEYYKEEALKH